MAGDLPDIPPIPPALGVSRAGKRQRIFNPLVPTYIDYPASHREKVGQLFNLFERDLDSMEEDLGCETCVGEGIPSWASWSAEGCGDKEVEVIEFYQRQVQLLENLLAQRYKKAGQSSTTSRSSSPKRPCGSHSRSVHSPRRIPPGTTIPSGSESPGEAPALVAVEWIGIDSVEALRFRFNTDEGLDDGRPWRRVELQPRERLRMLRGRGLGLADWIILITSNGRFLHLGGPLANPVPSFSFLCPPGEEIVGVTSSQGLIKDVQQRPVTSQMRRAPMTPRTPRRSEGSGVNTRGPLFSPQS